MRNFGERLTTKNTVELSAKVGTRASRTIYVHEDDMPLSEGDHFRYLNGFKTQEPTPYGFWPELGIVKDIRDRLGVDFYIVSRDGRPSEVDAITIPENQSEQDNE